MQPLRRPGLGLQGRADGHRATTTGYLYLVPRWYSAHNARREVASMIEIIAAITLSLILIGGLVGVFLLARTSRTPLEQAASEEQDDLASVREEVRRLRREVAAARSQHPRSTLMDMADAINRIVQPLVAAYDSAVLHVPLIDMALGKRIKVRLLSGRVVTFSLPPKTKAGARFRFRGGGEGGRDLHLTVLVPKTQETNSHGA